MLPAELGKAKDGELKALWLSWTDKAVKAALRRVAELRSGNNVAPAQAWTELNEIEALRQQWDLLSPHNSIPFTYNGQAAIEKAAATVRRETSDLRGWSERRAGTS